MKKILVVDDVREITELVVMILESDFKDYDFLEFSSGNQVINYLKNTKDNIALIISDHNMPDGTGSDLYSFIRESNFQIPYIHMSTGLHTEFERLKTLLHDNPANSNLTKPFDDEQLLAAVRFSLKESTQNIDNNFTKLKIDSVKLYIGEFFKVYIEVDKKPVLLFDDSNDADSTKLDELSKKGLKDILIETEEYKDWIKSKITQLNKLIGECTLQSPKTLKELTDTLFRQSTVIINMANPNDLRLEKVTESVQNVLGTLWEKPEVKKQVIEFFSHLGYISGHSSICLILSWLYAKKHQNSDIPLFTKLAYASLFHDISLHENELAMLIAKNDVEKSDYNSREKEYIYQHPIISAEKLEGWNIIDNDTLRIIKEHHEQPDATGYPKSLSKSNAHKLSTVFQFILQLSHRIYINQGNLDVSLDSMSKAFDLSEYHPLLDSLKRL